MEVDGAGRGEAALAFPAEENRLFQRVLAAVEQDRGGLVTPKAATDSSVFIPCTNTDAGKTAIIIRGT